MPPKAFSKLTDKQEDWLFEKAQKEPGLTLKQLAEWLKVEFQLTNEPNKSSISRVLKRKREDGGKDGGQAKVRKRQAAGKLPVSNNLSHR